MRQMRKLLPLILILSSLSTTLGAQAIVTESTTDSNITSSGSMTTTVNQPPPSAIAPQFSGGNNSDLCTVGVAGAVQTQILGISAGTTYTEEHCVRLKQAKIMYDMGMKVAHVEQTRKELDESGDIDVEKAVTFGGLGLLGLLLLL